MPPTCSVRGIAGNAASAEFWCDAGNPLCFRIPPTPQNQPPLAEVSVSWPAKTLSAKRPLPVKKETQSIRIPPTRSLFGVRASIWQVVAVVAGAGIGALIGGHLYSDETTIGAIVGLMFGTSGAGGRMNRLPRSARD